MLGCWLPSGLEDAGVSKATNCSRLFHGNGSSTNPADSWKSLDRIGHRKSRALSRPVNFHGLKASSYVKLHKGGLSFLFFPTLYSLATNQDLRHICLSRIVEPVCGTILASCPVSQNITKLPGAFFLGVCVVASLPGCDEMHLKSFKNSDTFRILLASNLETLWLNKCRNLGI